MEKDDTITLAASLAPGFILLSAALIITVRFHYRLLRQVKVPPATPTIIINQQINPTPNDIPLEQQPRIIAPIPRRLIPINNLARDEEREEIVSESTSPVILERRPPTPPRRRMPIIILSPTGSANSTPYAPRSPSPGEYARFISNGRGFNMGHDIRPVTPLDMHNHTCVMYECAPYRYRYDRNNMAIDHTKTFAHGMVRLMPNPYCVRTVVRIRIVSQ